MNNKISLLTKELRNKQQIKDIFADIKPDYDFLDKKFDLIPIMHVCGTHEDTLMKNGLRYLLTQEFPKIKMISGPGCPVCVSPAQDIDIAIELSLKVPNAIITSYGDMVRAPGSHGSLEYARQQGASIITVYSILDAISIAKKNPDKEIIFISPGFETTAPTTAVELKNHPPLNFSVLSSHRLVPPALEVLVHLPDLQIKGFILPGHVSVITGSAYYLSFSDKYHIPCAIAGFEPYDMMLGVRSVLHQLRYQKAIIDNVYHRAVTEEGNVIAKNIMNEVYQIVDADWRGLGKFPQSGLEIAESYSAWNARIKFRAIIDKVPPISRETPPGCSCPDVVIGKIEPEDCVLFKNACTPENPIGPCMVGLEGTCRIRALYS
ncbi:MAG: hydrogenase formation protein HypD [Candidatus Thorarchaeota archaeon]